MIEIIISNGNPFWVSRTHDGFPLSVESIDARALKSLAHNLSVVAGLCLAGMQALELSDADVKALRFARMQILGDSCDGPWAPVAAALDRLLTKVHMVTNTCAG